MNLFSFKPAVNQAQIPFSLEPVPAGFPNYASEVEHELLSLDDLCVRRPNSTYIVRVDGQSMSGYSILSGDYLVVDRSIEASHDKVIVAQINGEFTVKQFKEHPITGLQPYNDDYQFIPISENDDFVCCGVVVAVLRTLY